MWRCLAGILEECTPAIGLRPYSPTSYFYGTSFAGFTFSKGLIDYSTIANSNPTLLDVLNFLGNEDPNKLGFHVIGALLNAAAGKLPSYITAQLLFGMFNDVATQGYYSPMGSIQWDGAAVVNYLQQTQISSLKHGGPLARGASVRADKSFARPGIAVRKLESASAGRITGLRGVPRCAGAEFGPPVEAVLLEFLRLGHTGQTNS